MKNAPRRPPWSSFRAALEREGFRPSRRLGQNFLLDDNVAQAIVRDAGVVPGELVLEIGPGCGFLSLHLAAAGVRLLAVELDRRLAAIAREFLQPYPEARVLAADVLAGKHELAPEVLAELPRSGDWSVVSNLPYSVAGPALVLLSRLERPPRAMTVLVQAEVAERICARPGSPPWGPLAIRLQGRYGAERVRNVPRHLFWPRPKVESAVVRLLRLPGEPDRELERALDGLVRDLFQRRRKTLRASLRALLGGGDAAARLLAQAGVGGDRRPQELDLPRLRELARLGPWGRSPGTGGQSP